MKIHDLKPAAGSKKPRQRVGRGIGGKGGKTAGRGTKGQGARGSVKPGFEGGQTPLAPPHAEAQGLQQPVPGRVPRGQPRHPREFDAGSTVGPDELRAQGLVAKRGLVKVLGRGAVTKAVSVRAHAFSKSAKQAIEAAGGSVEIVPPAVGRSAPAGQGQRPHQPLGRFGQGTR